MTMLRRCVLMLLVAAVCTADPQQQHRRRAAATTAARTQSTTQAQGIAAKDPGLQPQGEFSVRDLPADTLRDFPGLCFASTNFRFFKVGDSWPLLPFCGVASCLTDGVQLVERVRDCGLLPKENSKCKIANPEARELEFPSCCPRFTCEAGVKLEYPTPEELQAFAEQAQRAQLDAASAAQQRQQRGGESQSVPQPVQV